MTLNELKIIAGSEMWLDGTLSKGVRVEILEKAKAGEAFEVIGSLFDRNRIYAELNRSGNSSRITTKAKEAGKTYILKFNSPKS